MISWRAAAYISRRADINVVPIGEIAVASDAVFGERWILIEALERWLQDWPALYGYFDGMRMP